MYTFLFPYMWQIFGTQQAGQKKNQEKALGKETGIPILVLLAMLEICHFPDQLN